MLCIYLWIMTINCSYCTFECTCFFVVYLFVFWMIHIFCHWLVCLDVFTIHYWVCLCKSYTYIETKCTRSMSPWIDTRADSDKSCCKLHTWSAYCDLNFVFVYMKSRVVNLIVVSFPDSLQCWRGSGYETNGPLQHKHRTITNIGWQNKTHE